VNASEARVVLLLGPTGEPVDDAESRHIFSLARRQK
jgi:hypothetical protein